MAPSVLHGAKGISPPNPLRRGCSGKCLMGMNRNRRMRRARICRRLGSNDKCKQAFTWHTCRQKRALVGNSTRDSTKLVANTAGRREEGSCGTRVCPVPDSQEHGNNPSDYVNGRKLLVQLSDYQHPKKAEQFPNRENNDPPNYLSERLPVTEGFFNRATCSYNATWSYNRAQILPTYSIRKTGMHYLFRTPDSNLIDTY